MRTLLLFTIFSIASCKADAPQSAAAPLTEAKPDEVPGTPPPGATTTSSGLAFQVLKPGVGAERPALQDRVRVEYLGWSTKGPFDSTKKSGGTEVFEMRGVVAGWTEALLEMRLGERRRLWLPDKLAYPNLRANPTLWVFEVELLEILRGNSPLPAPPDVAAAPADATRTASGLAYKLISEGGGHDKPNAWDRVALHYTGWTSDGAMRESAQEKPAVFAVAQVMPGWREALLLMAAGDRMRLWLPRALAQQEHSPEPTSDMVYDLTLVAVERLPEPPRAPTPLAVPPKDAVTTKDGLAYRLRAQGAGGAKPTLNDRVVMTYSAWTTDGELFDSSTFRGKPTSLPVRGLIPGWAEGLQLMAAGDKATFWIPEMLAYGGRDGAPRGMLVYEVELHDIVARPRSVAH
jgi:peptidylprolyl isomerase